MRKKDIMSDFTTEFYTNSEKGAVTCILRPCIDNALLAISEATGILPCTLPPSLLLNDTYKGTARCTEGDTYNESTGKSIAFRKAYAKYAVAMAKKTTMFMKETEAVCKQWMDGANEVVKHYTAKEDMACDKLRDVLYSVK